MHSTGICASVMSSITGMNAQDKLKLKLLNLLYFLCLRKHKTTLSSWTSQSFLQHYSSIQSMKQYLELEDFILRLQLMPNSNKGSSITKPKYLFSFLTQTFHRLAVILLVSFPFITKTKWFTNVYCYNIETVGAGPAGITTCVAWASYKNTRSY